MVKIYSYIKAKLPQSQQGDTIVEVLIALAIVSLVVVSAYAISTKNSAAAQEVQEQSSALKLIERQSELLLAAESVPTSAGCFNPDGDYVVAPASSCTVNGSGTEYDAATDSDASFAMSITKNTSTGVYTINAQWVTLSGKTANATMYARRAD